MLVFLEITLQMGQWIRDKLTNYWATTNQFHTLFYSSLMKRDGYCRTLLFLHVTDCNNEPDIMDENSDRLWKMRNLFEILNKTFSKFYSHIEFCPYKKLLFCSHEGSHSDNTYPRNTKVLASKFTNHVTRLDTRMIWRFILYLTGVGKFHIGILDSSSWMLYWKIWRKLVDTNST
jgi:hypothetical protein